jgi:hypothetical protein
LVFEHHCSGSPANAELFPQEGVDFKKILTELRHGTIGSILHRR